jgi:hypothetical protein
MSAPIPNPIVGMFMNLPQNDPEMVGNGGRLNAFLTAAGITISGSQPAPQYGAADYNNYNSKADALVSKNCDVYFATCWMTKGAIVRKAPGGKPIVFAGLFEVNDVPGVNGIGPNESGVVSYGYNLCRLWAPLLKATVPTITKVGILYDGGEWDAPCKTLSNELRKGPRA